MELAVRFLVHTFVPYDGRLDVEEYIDEGIVGLSTTGNSAEAVRVMERTFDLLCEVGGGGAIRRFDGEKHVGKVGLVGLEGIAVGVAKNLDAIAGLPNAAEFVREKMQLFWSQEETATFTSPGLRGTTRIQRTVAFGEGWFCP